VGARARFADARAARARAAALDFDALAMLPGDGDVRPTPLELEELAEPWRPHRATAARILWHAYLSERPRR
jgi:hypothetical protein